MAIVLLSRSNPEIGVPNLDGLISRGNTVDGQNPAPPQKPWFLMIQLQLPTNNGFNHAFKVVPKRILSTHSSFNGGPV